MDARLDQNQSEFGIAVLTIALLVLVDGHGLHDQEIQVLAALKPGLFSSRYTTLCCWSRNKPEQLHESQRMASVKYK